MNKFKPDPVLILIFHGFFFQLTNEFFKAIDLNILFRAAIAILCSYLIFDFSGEEPSPKIREKPPVDDGRKPRKNRFFDEI